eukprot:2146072-Alexandrium_andersonii.AAC.1
MCIRDSRFSCRGLRVLLVRAWLLRQACACRVLGHCGVGAPRSRRPLYCARAIKGGPSSDVAPRCWPLHCNAAVVARSAIARCWVLKAGCDSQAG